MNELNLNLQHSIVTLAGNGWSSRRIARKLGINRETVGKYLLLARPKPAISPPGSELDSNPKPAIPTSGFEPSPDSKPAISTAGSAAGRQSLCLPHLTQIEAAVGVGLSAQRIYQDLVCEHAFAGSCKTIRSAFAGDPADSFCADGSGAGGGGAGGFWPGRVGDGRGQTQREDEARNLNLKLGQLKDRLNCLTDAYLDNALDKSMFEERRKALILDPCLSGCLPIYFEYTITCGVWFPSVKPRVIRGIRDS